MSDAPAPDAGARLIFERITEDDFVGPVIVAARMEEDAWRLPARGDGRDVATLRELHWNVAQELAAWPARPTIVIRATTARRSSTERVGAGSAPQR